MRVFLFTLFLFVTSCLFGQTSDGNGAWTIGANWVGGTAPGTTGIATNVTIDNGSKIIRTGDLIFGNGAAVTLTVKDTLIVYGDLNLGNQPGLMIATTGFLVVVGDFYANSQTTIAQGGYLVVTGEFSENINENQGSITLDPDQTFLFDDSPTTKTGLGDDDYADEEDLIDDPIFDIIDEILGDYCNISVSGVVTGISAAGASDGEIEISVSGGTTYIYSWITSDGSGLVAADNEHQTGLSEGTYTVKIQDAGTACFEFESFTIGVSTCTPPVPSFLAQVAAPCVGSTGNVYTTEASKSSYVWTVSAGGSITAGGGATDNSVTVTWNTAGAQTVSVSYEDPVSCAAASPTISNVTVTPNNTVEAASSTPTLCINTALTDITHTTTGATGIGAATGLPAGVSASWNANTITISGTPTESGTFDYDIPLTGGCGSISASGTITVNPLPTITVTATPAAICFGESVNLTATGGSSYTWSSLPVASLSDLSATDVANPTYTPLVNPTTGTAPDIKLVTTFSVVVSDGACSNTGTVDVTVYRLPETGPQYHIENSWGN